MKEKCYNHPEKKALSRCHSCKRYSCEECLLVGPEYYYCTDEHCQEAYRKEVAQHVSSGAVTSSPPYLSGHSRAQWVIGFLAITIILAIIAYVSDYLQIDLLSRAMEGQMITEAEASSNDTRQQLIGILQLMTFIVTGILFLMWIYRSHRNLPALGARNLTYTPGWTVAGFFIPFLNLIRPFQVMREIWKASDPRVNVINGFSWENAPSSPLVQWWWPLFLIDGFVSNIAGGMYMSEESIDALYTGTWAMLASEVIGIVSALVIIYLIKAIDQRQKEKHEYGKIS